MLIRLNSVGYLPTSPKVATIVEAYEEFAVEETSTSRIQWLGRTRPWVAPGEHEPSMWLADFSEVRAPGRYRLVVKGVGNSPPFRVAEGVYNQAFYAVMRGMYLSRCGTPVAGPPPGDGFRHPACHLDDGYVDFVRANSIHQHQDGAGGWHDAGDYNKYVVNGAFTVGMMLHAWLHFEDRIARFDLQIPDGDPRLPDFIEEVKWELDWLLKMQAADGRVYHKLSTLEFGGFMMPDKERTPRYFSPWGTAATADFAAVMALAGRVYRPYDAAFAERCLAAAKLSYRFLQDHPGDHRPDQRSFKTGGYDSSDQDDRLWAAAELWAATGDKACLRDLEERLRTSESLRRPGSGVVSVAWDWGNPSNLGVFTYLQTDDSRRDAELLLAVRQDLIDSADRIVAEAKRHCYGRPLGERYYWGCNGAVARQTMNLHLAFRLTGDAVYSDTSLSAVAYLFGRNPYGRSFVTGVGFDPPRFPHDRRSGADPLEAPWPGYLVGGGWPTASDWRDEQKDFRTNEIAINWNGALIYALAGFVDPLMQ